MKLLMSEKKYFGDDMKIVSNDELCTVFKISDKTGKGIMTCYKIFDGIDVVYNNFNMESCFTKNNQYDDVMEINYCSDGRIECKFENGTYCYMESGDFSISTKATRITSSCFPLNYYYGVSIVVCFDILTDEINQFLDGIQVDLYKIRKKFCENNKIFIMRAKKSIGHIFSEFYDIPEELRISYSKLKVLELLLFLSNMNVKEDIEKREYYEKSQVDKIKSIMDFLTSNLSKHYTISELSVRFEISETSLKRCFKAIYGEPIYSFIRKLRIQSASYMLKNTKYSVIDIAGRVGYINSSKFASAFKDIIGVSPLEYRKRNIRSEHFTFKSSSKDSKVNV